MIRTDKIIMRTRLGGMMQGAGIQKCQQTALKISI